MVQSESVQLFAPPPAPPTQIFTLKDTLAENNELLTVQDSAPPPLPDEKLPEIEQLFSTAELTPPASPLAVFPEIVQLKNLPRYAPPATLFAALPEMIQFEMNALESSHQSPPPLCSVPPSPAMRVAPPISVKPINPQPLVRYTHRTALSPFVVSGVWYP